MKIRVNKEFPYPVLRSNSDDYVNSSFEADVSGRVIGYECELHLKAALSDEGIQKLINERKAALTYHIECSQTGYRKIHLAESFDERHCISLKSLRGNVEVNTFIVATEDIPVYRNKNLNEDYAGEVKNICKGFILAQGSEFDLNIPRKFTDFKEQNNPFVSVVPVHDDALKTMKVDLDKPKIVIMVPEKVSINYGVAQKTHQMRTVLYSMFVVPALYQGLLRLKRTNDVDLGTMEDQLWVQSLEDLLKTNFKKTVDDIRETSEEDLYELAQQLMDSPLPEASNYLVSRGDEE